MSQARPDKIEFGTPKFGKITVSVDAKNKAQIKKAIDNMLYGLNYLKQNMKENGKLEP